LHGSAASPILDLSPKMPADRSDAAREERLAELMEEFSARRERQAEALAVLEAVTEGRSHEDQGSARPAGGSGRENSTDSRRT
jgi:hypothetical protein